MAQDRRPVEDEQPLVIVAHPDLGSSRVNARWMAEIEKSGTAVLHDLYATYPDGVVDAAREQDLLERHCVTVFQFPVYWYSCPTLLRTWFDTVYQAGWAYGDGNRGNRLAGRRFAAAVSAGDVERNYREGGKVGFTMEQALTPFAATCNYVGAKWMGNFALYGAEVDLSDDRLDASAAAYIDWLSSL